MTDLSSIIFEYFIISPAENSHKKKINKKMKLIIPNIVWHGDRERILAVTFHPILNLFMTGGSDCEKRLED